eukprot:symbB.v1.2.026089.t1/scaffold2489.1/size77871/2
MNATPLQRSDGSTQRPKRRRRVASRLGRAAPRGWIVAGTLRAVGIGQNRWLADTKRLASKSSSWKACRVTMLPMLQPKLIGFATSTWRCLPKAATSPRKSLYACGASCAFENSWNSAEWWREIPGFQYF